MKTAIIFKDKQEDLVLQVFDYENEEQRKFLMEQFIKGLNIIAIYNIDGFSYMQHKINNHIPKEETRIA